MAPSAVRTATIGTSTPRSLMLATKSSSLKTAAAAEISTRTFFGYFASKEDLLFPDSQARVQAVLHAIDQRRPGDRPVEVLLRALEHVAASDADMISPLASVRVRLIQTVSSVHGRGLQVLFSAQRNIARHLLAAFPSELDEISSAALVAPWPAPSAPPLPSSWKIPPAPRTPTRCAPRSDAPRRSPYNPG
jgi:AcrR family transcriptional regulator